MKEKNQRPTQCALEDATARQQLRPQRQEIRARTQAQPQATVQKPSAASAAADTRQDHRKGTRRARRTPVTSRARGPTAGLRSAQAFADRGQCAGLISRPKGAHMTTNEQRQQRTPEQERARLRTEIALETEIMIMAARTGAPRSAREAQRQITKHTNTLLKMAKSDEADRRSA